MTQLKPFNEVQVGDHGIDYALETGIVIKTGIYDDLKRYDSTGACDGTLGDDEKSQMVAVEIEGGEKLLYVYGEDGFGVYV